MAIGIKTGGRSKGVPNKKTVDQLSRAEKILQLIEKTYFEKDIKELTASQRIVLYADMLEYVSPKLSRQEINGNVNNKVFLEIVRTTTTPIEYTSSAPAKGSR